jgi:photosystem II stability/assembly factor-like uncharacterized protein
MRKSFFFFLILVSACLVVSAQSWQRVGPEGGNVSGLARHPGNPNEMLAVIGGNSGQVLKTTNAGGTWQVLATLNRSLKDVAYDPSNPNLIYVLPNYADRLFKSTNGGGNWTEHPFGSNRSAHTGLIVDPANPSTIYVAGIEYWETSPTWKNVMAVHKSTNGGASWSSVRVGPLTQYGGSLALAISPSDSRILYASGSYYDGSRYVNRVYKSINQGASWQNITGSIGESVAVRTLAVDPQSPSRVFAGSSWGVYRSSDGGAGWTKNNGTVYAESITIDPGNSHTLYAGYGARVFKSTDGGVNWTSVTAGLAGICGKVLASSSGTYFGSTAGFFFSRDGGASWTAGNQGISAVEIGSLAYSPSSPQFLYAEGKGNGFFKSTNFGSSWQRMPDFYRCDAIDQILINPSNGQDLYILAGG